MPLMVNLLDLDPYKISRDLSNKFLLIYGQPKVGKTTFITQIEGSLLLAFEPGFNALDGVMVVQIVTWYDFKKLIPQFRQPAVQEKFKLLGIDTADKAWEMCEKYICQQNNVSKLGDLPWGQGYDLCKKEFSSVFDELAKLGYGLCFVSHSAEKRMKDEKGEEYIQLAPALPTRPYDIINKMVDCICYISSNGDVNKGATGHKIWFRGNQNFLAGSRFKYIEPCVDFDYENVRDALLEAIDKQKEASGSANSTESTINEFYVDKTLDFETLMKEAGQLWMQKVGNDEAKGIKAHELIKKAFGKDMRVSEATPDQVESLAVFIAELKAM